MTIFQRKFLFLLNLNSCTGALFSIKLVRFIKYEFARRFVLLVFMLHFHLFYVRCYLEETHGLTGVPLILEGLFKFSIYWSFIVIIKTLNWLVQKLKFFILGQF